MSGLPWFKVYQYSTPSDMFDMFVYLLSSAVEKHAPYKTVGLLLIASEGVISIRAISQPNEARLDS